MANGDPIPQQVGGYYYTPGYYPSQQCAQQGWQCPICKSVWAPFMPACSKCASVTVTVTTGGDTQPIGGSDGE